MSFDRIVGSRTGLVEAACQRSLAKDSAVYPKSDTGGEVKNGAHSELEFVELQA